MILFTTGTNEQPFDRLVRAAQGLGGTERLVVQYGSSSVEPGRGEWVDFVGFDALAQLMEEARVVVCHAGVGSIMLARKCGASTIVMPRRHHLGEAVDDHQVPLARRLEAAGLVTLVEDEAALAAALVAVDSPLVIEAAAAGLPGASSLATALRERFVSAHVTPA